MKRTCILSFLLDDNVSVNTVKTIPCFGTGKNPILGNALPGTGAKVKQGVRFT